MASFSKRNFAGAISQRLEDTDTPFRSILHVDKVEPEEFSSYYLLENFDDFVLRGTLMAEFFSKSRSMESNNFSVVIGDLDFLESSYHVKYLLDYRITINLMI